jgi:hypothetical protein
VSDELSIPRSPVYRVTRRSGPDRMTRRLLLIAGGLAGALVLIVVLWSSVGHHGGQVPVVQADQRPVRVKPANPGGMQIPGLGSDTGAGASAASGDRLAPAPETPDPQALARQTPPAAPATTRTGPAPPVVAPAQPVIAAVAPPAPAAAKPARVAAAAVPERRAAPTAERAPVGRTQVQLAALGTETAARQEWERLAHRMPGVLRTHRPVFSKIEHDGHTLWRVRTGDFTTEAEASQFCQQVKAKGGGCSVAAF